MPKIGGIEFIYTRKYFPPDVPQLDYDEEEFFAHIKGRVRHPKVIVELVPVNISRTMSSFYIEALFYLLEGDQIITSSKKVQITTIKEAYEGLSEILNDKLGKKK